MSALLLGVDGGGSKTAFALCDLAGRILARFQGDTSNYNQVGFDGVTAALTEGLAALRQEADPDHVTIAGAVLGLGGVGEIAGDDPLLRAAVRDALGDTPHLVVNDAEVGWAGALALAPGINVVAGTGSIAYGVNASGDTARAGGWAWAVGDEGSAHWLGRRILQVFTQQADGRRPRTALYACVRERLGVKDDVEVRFLPLHAPRKDVAALSTILPEALARGDETPQALYAEAAEELALHVNGIRSQIRFEEPVDVSGTGGVFRSTPFVREAFARVLPRHGARYVSPRATPVEGALMMAARAFRPKALGPLRARLAPDRHEDSDLPEPTPDDAG